MNRKVIALLMMVVFCALIPIASHAQSDGVEITQKADAIQTESNGKIIGNERKTVFHAAFKNEATGQIEPEALGWGTLDCVNAGNHWMDCAWNITSTSRITYINVDVVFSSGGSNGYNYPINPPVFTVGSTAEEYIDIPGEYFAVLEGTVTTYSGTYELVPVLAEDVYMD